MKLHKILLFAAVVSFSANAGNITLSSDTLLLPDEPYSHFTDTVTLSNAAALRADIDSARILFYGINGDQIDFGNAYMTFIEHYEDERNTIIWTLQPLEGNEYEYSLHGGPLPEPERWPMAIYGNGDSIKMSAMRIGTCLECASINLIQFSDAWLTLFYNSGDAVVLHLVQAEPTSVRKAALPRPVNVNAQNVAGSFLLNGRLAPASLVKINDKGMHHVIVRDIKR